MTQRPQIKPIPFRNIKLTIEYDGSLFHGWQTQNKNERTIQEEIEKALKFIFKSDIKLTGSGRTDSGVHALGQVANFKAKTLMTTDQIVKAINANLPEDVVILEAQNVKDDFHAQYSIKTKTYRYCISQRNVRPVVEQNYSLHFPHKLNLQKMKEAAKILTGRHDFKSFQANDPRRDFSKKGSTVRTIKQITIKKKNNQITIDIEADGFLYKMVRNIIGTLLDVGIKKITTLAVKEILRKKNRIFAGITAKSHGLFLLKATYKSS